MKYILILLLVPLFSFAQLTDAEKADIDLIKHYYGVYSNQNYRDAIDLSDALLKKHPQDSLVLINRVRLYDSYITKSKCNKYMTPKSENLCSEAIAFYDANFNTINNPRVHLSFGRVYYYLALYEGFDAFKPAAKQHFEKAIASGAFNENEINYLKEYLIQL